MIFLDSLISESISEVNVEVEAEVMEDRFDLGIAFKFVDKSTTAVDRAAS